MTHESNQDTPSAWDPPKPRGSTCSCLHTAREAPALPVARYPDHKPQRSTQGETIGSYQHSAIVTSGQIRTPGPNIGLDSHS